MRRENKERHTVLAARSWASALLAAQRRNGNAVSGEVAN
jgi:hypothetical protein